MATSKTTWLVYAIASGCCAALNGVFAKLTTTQLTTSWATSISHGFGLKESSKFFEYVFRALFFALNLVFNGIMWGLFTRALTLASSTVRVSIINTSANFMVTAVLGLLVFSETLPGLWWLGAAFLVAGSVIIGRREEAKDVGAAGTAGVEGESRTWGADAGDEGTEDERDGEGAYVDEPEPDAPIDDAWRDSIELSPTKDRGAQEELR